LSQLNRNCEERASKRPQLSDLRESGTLEQDADIVIMLNRPAHYGFAEMETDEGPHMSSRSVMELIIAKNRNGVTGSIFLYHNDSLTVIEDNKPEPAI
jgi:replicative DNA helicase